MEYIILRWSDVYQQYYKDLGLSSKYQIGIDFVDEIYSKIPLG